MWLAIDIKSSPTSRGNKSAPPLRSGFIASLKSENKIFEGKKSTRHGRGQGKSMPARRKLNENSFGKKHAGAGLVEL